MAAVIVIVAAAAAGTRWGRRSCQQGPWSELSLLRQELQSRIELVAQSIPKRPPLLVHHVWIGISVHRDRIHSQGTSCTAWSCRELRHRSWSSFVICHGQRSTKNKIIIIWYTQLQNKIKRVQLTRYIIWITYLVTIFALLVQFEIFAHFGSKLVNVGSGWGE